MPWSIRLKTGAAKAINKLDKPVRDKNINDQHAAQYGYAYWRPTAMRLFKFADNI
ncbi:hypothetical protein QLH52_05260 [Methylomonas sp. OY6]|uniref:Uncharacterized protein n=1 Tax=Methylomonas defluvii TaxID=3045149 RepID=A0ABU4UB56_9GAMM|nr:hypothetical protein [Methylomonas sp. OY6]MDX8126679.1 hypothetical protein [Methylomonas sp. OY6]